MNRVAPLRWAVVGTGRIARRVGVDIASLPDAHIVAVQSRAARLEASFRSDVSDGPVFVDPHDLIDAVRPDVAYVAVPHSLHAAYAQPYVDAGVAVLVEKPLTNSYAMSKKLLARAEERDTFCLEAMWTRFNPVVQRLREMVGAGEIGVPTHLTAEIGFTIPFDADSREWNPSLGGGATLDLGVYPIALATMIFGGPPEKIRARASLAPNGVDERVDMQLSWSHGAVADLRCSLADSIAGAAVVEGTEGTITLAAPFQRTTSLTVVRKGSTPSEFSSPLQGNGFIPMLRDVHGRLRSGQRESPHMTPDDSLTVAFVVEEVLEQVGALRTNPPSTWEEAHSSFQSFSP